MIRIHIIHRRKEPRPQPINKNILGILGIDDCLSVRIKFAKGNKEEHRQHKGWAISQFAHGRCYIQLNPVSNANKRRIAGGISMKNSRLPLVFS